MATLSTDPNQEYPELDRPGPDHRAETPNRIISSPEVRKYLYAFAAAVLATLVLFDIVTEEQLQEWVRVLGYVVGLAPAVLAAFNTPTPKE